jgi:hypothetical protein
MKGAFPITRIGNSLPADIEPDSGSKSASLGDPDRPELEPGDAGARLDLDELMSVAQGLVAAESICVDRARRALARYDAESERLMAEAAGRVRSLEARIHVADTGMSDGRPPVEDLVHARDELGLAREANEGLLWTRLDGRQPAVREFGEAARRMLDAGETFLRLGLYVEQYARAAAGPAGAEATTTPFRDQSKHCSQEGAR